MCWWPVSTGRNSPKTWIKSVHSALLVCLAAGVLLLVVGVAFSPALMRLLGTKPDLIDGAILYLRIYFLGMPAMAIYNFGNGVFSAVGDTRKPLVYLTIAGVLNVILDLFFVIVCKMSVAGAALATILTQYLSAFLILRCAGAHRGVLRPAAGKAASGPRHDPQHPGAGGAGRLPERHFCPGQPVHSGQHQHLRHSGGQRQLRCRQRRPAGLRCDGRFLPPPAPAL